MLSQEISDRVDWLLQELYERHLSLHEDEVIGYYDSGVGYRKPEVPSTERDRFSVCLASTDGTRAVCTTSLASGRTGSGFRPRAG